MIDEIFSREYLENKYEKNLLKLRETKIHLAFERWKENLPGEYERYKYEKGSKKETQIGYNWVNMEAVNEEIIFLIDDYYFPVYTVKPRKGTEIVQVWHACGAIKKFGNALARKYPIKN